MEIGQPSILVCLKGKVKIIEQQLYFLAPHQDVQLEDVSTNALSQQSGIPYQDHQEFLDVSEMLLRIIRGNLI